MELSFTLEQYDIELSDKARPPYARKSIWRSCVVENVIGEGVLAIAEQIEAWEAVDNVALEVDTHPDGYIIRITVLCSRDVKVLCGWIDGLAHLYNKHMALL